MPARRFPPPWTVDTPRAFCVKDATGRAPVLNSARSLFPLRGTGHSSVTVVLPQKSILDFRVDLVQPLLRTVGFVLINPNLSFQFRDPIFGRAKLMGKLLRHLKSMMTVCFGHAGGLVKQSQNGVPCFIELITIVGNRVFRRKRNHRI